MLAKYIIIIIYIISGILLCSSSASYHNAKHQNIIFCLLTFVMVLIAALRPETMPDYSNYTAAVASDLSYDANRFEPTFNVIKTISNRNAIVLFFIYSTLSIGVRMRQIYKLSPLMWGSLLVYISYIFILHDNIQIRAAVASALLFVIIPYIYERKFTPFLITCFIALLFHYSAAIFFLLWFVNPHKTQRFIYLACLLGAYLLAVSGITISWIISSIPFEPIQALYSLHSSKVDEYINIFNALQIGRCTVCFFFWYKIQIISKQYPLSLILLKIYTIALGLLPLFSDITALSVRLNQLLLVVEILLVPAGFYFTFKQKYVSKLCILFFASIILIFTISNPVYWGE